MSPGVNAQKKSAAGASRGGDYFNQRQPMEPTQMNYSSAAFLSPDQHQALWEILDFAASTRPTHALSGPAGTGKTYLMRHVLAQVARNVRLSATTNKAAAVCGQLAPGSDARTIHNLLGLQPEADYRKGRMVLKRKRDPKVKPGDLVVIDESSMIDGDLLRLIREYAARIGFQVLFVGDAGQLPPIFEPASPAFSAVPTSRLTTVHRQALDNPILAAATNFRRVLDGEAFPTLQGQDRGLVAADGRQFTEWMLDTFDSDAYEGDGDFCRALAWSNKRVIELNRVIRRRLIGPEADRWPILPGESCIVNDALLEDEDLVFPTESLVAVHSVKPAALCDKETGINVAGHWVEVSNSSNTGEAFVPTDREAARGLLSAYASKARALQRECEGWKKARQPAPDDLDERRRAAWREFFKVKGQLADLRPPHASTVHKSQGSTIEHVFIDVADIGRCTRADLIARLMYVALTRPRQTAIITGELPARLYPLQEAA